MHINFNNLYVSNVTGAMQVDISILSLCKINKSQVEPLVRENPQHLWLSRTTLDSRYSCLELLAAVVVLGFGAATTIIYIVPLNRWHSHDWIGCQLEETTCHLVSLISPKRNQA